jgi:hypothetical protein
MASGKAMLAAMGGSGLRVAVNRALSQIYDSDAIGGIFRGAFGPNAKPGVALILMYRPNVYPE